MASYLLSALLIEKLEDWLHIYVVIQSSYNVNSKFPWACDSDSIELCFVLNIFVPFVILFIIALAEKVFES